jgi:hypothetical protein
MQGGYDAGGGCDAATQPPNALFICSCLHLDMRCGYHAFAPLFTSSIHFSLKGVLSVRVESF